MCSECLLLRRDSESLILLTMTTVFFFWDKQAFSVFSSSWEIMPWCQKEKKKEVLCFEVGISDLWSLWEEALGGSYPVLSSADSRSVLHLFIFSTSEWVNFFFVFLTRNWAIKVTLGAREKSMLIPWCLSPLRNVVSNCVKAGSVRMGGLDT